MADKPIKKNYSKPCYNVKRAPGCESGNGYSSAHKTIPPEEVKSGVLYTLTINPSNQLDDCRNSLYNRRHVNVILTMVASLEAQNPESFNFLLWPESKNGRIHFHGVIEILDPFVFDIFVLPRWKSIFSYEIDTITDINYWVNVYCKKQNGLWESRPDVLSKFGRKVKRINAIIEKTIASMGVLEQEGFSA